MPTETAKGNRVAVLTWLVAILTLAAYIALHFTPNPASVYSAHIYYNTEFTEGGGSHQRVIPMLLFNIPLYTTKLNALTLIVHNGSSYPAHKVNISVVPTDGSSVALYSVPTGTIFTDVNGKSLRHVTNSISLKEDEVINCEYMPPGVIFTFRFYCTGKQPQVSVLSELAVGELKPDLKAPPK